MLEKSRRFPITRWPIEPKYTGTFTGFREAGYMTGKVKNLVVKRAFGFILSERGAEIFFHKDDFIGHWDDLVSDYEAKNPINVEFEIKESPKGARASKVRRTDHPNQAV